MGVAGERHGVGKLLERARRNSPVVAPRPRPLNGVPRMRVLRVEERFAVSEVELSGVRLKEGVEVLLVPPVRADERVALDGLGPDRAVRLVENALPHLGAVFSVVDCSGLEVGFVLALVPAPAANVVVAVHPQLLDVASVRCLAVREHAPETVGRSLDLLDAPGVRDVACDQHAVCAVVAEILKRLDQRVLVAAPFEMYVAQHSERHVWRSSGHCWHGLAVGNRHSTRSGKCACYKTSS